MSSTRFLLSTEITCTSGVEDIFLLQGRSSMLFQTDRGISIWWSSNFHTNVVRDAIWLYMWSFMIDLMAEFIIEALD